MSTEAQAKSNREDAQKSTGPKTAEGKAAVAQNAVKHGLFAVQDVLTTENQAEFDLMREEMLAELAPVGVIESLLAQRAVSLAWRLKRAERMGNEAIEEIIEYKITGPLAKEITRLRCEAQGIPKDHPTVQEDHLTMGRVVKHDRSNQRTLDHMFAYERRIENSLYRAIAKLRAMQMLRQMTAADAEAKRRAQAQEEENSAKQSQFAPFTAENAEIAEQEDKEGHSEKQSQSAPVQMDVTSVLEDSYVERPLLWAARKQSQSKPIPAAQSQSTDSKTRVALRLLNL